jgi:hypothetical protein
MSRRTRGGVQGQGKCRARENRSSGITPRAPSSTAIQIRSKEVARTNSNGITREMANTSTVNIERVGGQLSKSHVRVLSTAQNTANRLKILPLTNLHVKLCSRAAQVAARNRKVGTWVTGCDTVPIFPINDEIRPSTTR